jgi:hypothetical protein
MSARRFIRASSVGYFTSISIKHTGSIKCSLQPRNPRRLFFYSILTLVIHMTKRSNCRSPALILRVSKLTFHRNLPTKSHEKLKVLRQPINVISGEPGTSRLGDDPVGTPGQQSTREDEARAPATAGRQCRRQVHTAQARPERRRLPLSSHAQRR